MKAAFRIGILLLAGSYGVLADVSYQENVRYTGGTLLDMVKNMQTGFMGKMMGGRLGRAFEDRNMKVYLKGNKMARIGTDLSTIVDLDGGTITTIDNQKQSYSTVTFEEMNQRMAQASQRMSRSNQDAAKLKFDAKVDDTGKTRTIDGQTAKEYVLTITEQSEQGGGMKVRSDLWAVSSLPGIDELRSFGKKMAEKMSYVLGANPMLGAAGAGMQEMTKEVMKMEGYPLSQEMTVTGVQSPMGPMMGMGNGNANSDPSAPFLISVTESSNFKADGVSDSVFQVPAGYKQQKADRGR